MVVSVCGSRSSLSSGDALRPIQDAHHNVLTVQCRLSGNTEIDHAAAHIARNTSVLRIRVSAIFMLAITFRRTLIAAQYFCAGCESGATRRRCGNESSETRLPVRNGYRKSHAWRRRTGVHLPAAPSDGCSCHRCHDTHGIDISSFQFTQDAVNGELETIVTVNGSFDLRLRSQHGFHCSIGAQCRLYPINGNDIEGI